MGQSQAWVNWESFSRKSNWHKILGGMLGSLTLICVAAACQLIQVHLADPSTPGKWQLKQLCVKLFFLNVYSFP